MHELVFGPLRMHSALFGVPGESGSPGGKGQLMGYTVAKNGYQPYVIHEPQWAATQTAAGGGLSMTIKDLLTFAEYNLDGLRGHVTLMSADNFNVLHKLVGRDRYGCGWIEVRGVTREPYQGHNGTDGTFRSEMALWPEKNLAIVSIANAGARSDPPPPQQAVIAIYNRFDRAAKG